MNMLLRLTPALLVTLLAGCGSRNFADIDTWIAEVNARPRGPVEALPPFEQVQPYAYQASAKRQPFEPPVMVKEVMRRPGVQVKPDFDRVKQYLEQFPIAELSMVGTLAQKQLLFALIRDPEGGVHKVQVGDYLGTDYGRITSIQELEVQLTEIVADGTGGWVERSRTVSLGGGEEA